MLQTILVKQGQRLIDVYRVTNDSDAGIIDSSKWTRHDSLVEEE